MRIFVIGDVHGCTEELRDLVSLADPQAGDRLVFVGDLVDKGPDSVGAVRMAAELLLRFPGSTVVAGNHEEKAIRRHRQGKLELLEPWALDMTASDWAFLKTMPLMLTIDGPTPVRVVHGGLVPAYFASHELPKSFPENWHSGGGKLMERARRFLRVRQVDADGDMLSLEDAKPEDRHWSTVYDGRAGLVVFGHDPQLSGQPLVAPHAVGVDTAVVHGGRLTALVLQDGKREFLSVPARRQYAPPLHTAD